MGLCCCKQETGGPVIKADQRNPNFSDDLRTGLLSDVEEQSSHGFRQAQTDDQASCPSQSENGKAQDNWQAQASNSEQDEEKTSSHEQDDNIETTVICQDQKQSLAVENGGGAVVQAQKQRNRYYERLSQEWGEALATTQREGDLIIFMEFQRMDNGIVFEIVISYFDLAELYRLKDGIFDFVISRGVYLRATVPELSECSEEFREHRLQVINSILDRAAEDVESATRCLEFYEHHYYADPAEIAKPIRSVKMEKIVEDIWDADFTNSLTKKKLYKAILFANACEPSCTPIVHLLCARVATMIKGKSPEEIQQILGDYEDEEDN